MIATPRLGVGLNFQGVVEDQFLRHLDQLDVVEVISDSLFQDNWIGAGLRHILQTKPVILHGLRCSPGAAEPLDPSYLASTLAAIDRWRPHWFSDHLAFSTIGGLDVHQLMPVRRTEANLRRVVDKVRQISAAAGVPFLLENITYYFDSPECAFSEAEFLNRILREADCGLLLDVNNLYINAHNHGFDPYVFLDQIDLSRVREIHMAGGFARDGMLIDSHGHRIGAPVWELLAFVCARARPSAIIIERDVNFDWGDMLESVARARDIFNQHQELAIET